MLQGKERSQRKLSSREFSVVGSCSRRAGWGDGRLPFFVLKRKREECVAASRPAAAGSLGASLLDGGTGVRRDVTVLVGGFVQVQGLLVDLKRHAAPVEGRDWCCGHRHIWASGERTNTV